MTNLSSFALPLVASSQTEEAQEAFGEHKSNSSPDSNSSLLSQFQVERMGGKEKKRAAMQGTE
jgi:hypothetical protein